MPGVQHGATKARAVPFEFHRQGCMTAPITRFQQSMDGGALLVNIHGAIAYGAPSQR